MLASLFNKVTELKVCNFIKKRLQRRCFSVNIAEFLRTAFYMEHLQRLHLKTQGKDPRKKHQKNRFMEVNHLQQ